MSDTSGAEDDRISAETNRIAAEGGRISAEGERVTAGEARDTADTATRARRLRLTLAQLVAYGFICVIGSLGFYRVESQQAQIDAAQTQQAISQSCTEQFLVKTVSIADQRTNITGEVQNADRAQNVAWADYLSAALGYARRGVEQPESDAIKAVERYFDKLQLYLDALAKAERNRKEDPYPDVQDYRNCLDRAESGGRR